MAMDDWLSRQMIIHKNIYRCNFRGPNKEHLLNEVILQHLYRQGHLTIAQTLAEVILFFIFWILDNHLAYSYLCHRDGSFVYNSNFLFPPSNFFKISFHKIHYVKDSIFLRFVNKITY